MSGARSTLAHGAWAVRFSGRSVALVMLLSMLAATHSTRASAADSNPVMRVGEAVATATQGLPGVTVAPIAPDERMLVESD